MSTFADRTLVVSGGSRGIGLAIALGAAKQGANVVLLAKTTEPHPKLPGTVHTAVAEVEAAGGKGVAVVGDVRKEEDVQRAVDAAVERFGGVDIVVNNASAIATDPTEQLSAKKFDLMMDINVRGTFLLTKAALPHLRKSANAHVMTLAPPLNMNPYWLGAHPSYTLSKYGMTLLSLGWAAEYADAGIGFSCLWPETYIATAAVTNAPGFQEALARSRDPRSWPTRRSRSCPARPRRSTGSASSTSTFWPWPASPTCPATAVGTTPSWISSSTNHEHLVAA